MAALIAAPTGGQPPVDAAKPTTAPGSRPPARTLGLEDAIRTAIANSKALRSAEESFRRARGRVDESKTGFFPTLGAEATVTHLDEGSSFTLTDPNNNPVTIPIVKQTQKQVGVTAVLPVDILGQIRAAVQLSEFLAAASRLEYAAARNQLVLDVRSAYFDLLRARAFVRVAERTLQNAEDRLKTAEQFRKAEVGTKFDVLRAETEVANARQALIGAGNRVQLATAALCNSLGLDQNTPIGVADGAEVTMPGDSGFDNSLETAYRNRPELLQADVQIHAAEKGLILALRSALPSLSLAWNFQYSPDQGGFAPKTTSWAAVARLTLPLFDGGLYRAKQQQARADVQSARIAKAQIQDGIALEVRQAALNLTDSEERLKVAEVALAQAEEQYRLAQVRFKAGVTQTPGASPLLEISDAQTALTQAQNNQINAQFDIQIARARLSRAMGREAFGEQVSRLQAGKKENGK